MSTCKFPCHDFEIWKNSPFQAIQTLPIHKYACHRRTYVILRIPSCGSNSVKCCWHSSHLVEISSPFSPVLAALHTFAAFGGSRLAAFSLAYMCLWFCVMQLFSKCQHNDHKIFWPLASMASAMLPKFARTGCAPIWQPVESKAKVTCYLLFWSSTLMRSFRACGYRLFQVSPFVSHFVKTTRTLVQRLVTKQLFRHSPKIHCTCVQGNVEKEIARSTRKQFCSTTKKMK